MQYYKKIYQQQSIPQTFSENLQEKSHFFINLSEFFVYKFTESNNFKTLSK